MSAQIIGVVGAGQMGAGIAQVAMSSGYEVYLTDTALAAREKAKASIEKSLQKLSEKKLLSEAAADILKRLHFAESAAELAKAAPFIVIEAIVESVEAKKKLFAELDKNLPKDCILASNTSSISITKIAAATTRPDKVVGMHFMNPVPIMKLVELIRGLATSDETFAKTQTLAIKMGKTTAVSKDMPGFIVNRILMPMINEAVIALSEGLGTAEDIDIGMKLGTNQPMGPLALADFIGLDTCLAIMEVLHGGLGDTKYRPSPLLRQYVDAGWLGKKSGRGFYRYD